MTFAMKASMAAVRPTASAARRTGPGANGLARGVSKPKKSALRVGQPKNLRAEQWRLCQVANTTEQKTATEGEDPEKKTDDKQVEITVNSKIGQSQDDPNASFDWWVEDGKEKPKDAAELMKSEVATIEASAKVAADAVAEAAKSNKEEVNDPFPAISEAELSFDEAQDGEKVWQRLKKTNAIQRTIEIWWFVVKFLFKRWKVEQKWAYGKEGKTEEAKRLKIEALAVWLRENLVQLGPTFIKAGQQFSTRVDVLSKEFIKELEQLQDNVPAFGIKAARQIVEEEFGMPIEQKFTYFEETPIAAASLGQVHRARLGDEEVVVKVQRPGLKAIFDIDLKNIRVLASLLQKLDPKTDGAARDWVAIYDECARCLYDEIDYRKEGENATTFRSNLAAYDWAKVPEIKWDSTTARVLTMEYCPGVKINNVEALDELGFDRQRLARLTVESYLLQILKFGLFHADPHPGNISVDKKTGQIIYYDFGMMGQLRSGVKEGLNKLFFSIYQRNADEAIVALKMMGVFVPSGDNIAVKRTANFFINSFYDRLENQVAEREEKGEAYSKEFKEKRTKEEKQARRKEILGNIGEDLLSVSKDQPFRFPAEFTFVIRAFTVLDGLGKSLDKKFDISEISRPYARELMQEGSSRSASVTASVVKRATRQSQAVVNLFKSPDRIEELYSTIISLQNGDFKLRVRALEAERALDRVSKMQAAQTQGMLATAALNAGTVLYVSELLVASQVAFGLGGLLAVMAVGSLLKVKGLEKKEQKYASGG